MSSLRMDFEQAMGLRFPERNGEVIVHFEESMDIPPAAETLMRGVYREPERIRQGFKTLHQETGTLIDILMPRRSRLREWAESLPERPKEAEKFLKETAEQLLSREQRLLQAEKELIGHLEESGLADVFPIHLTAFGLCAYKDPSVKIFLKPLGRFAEIMQINPDVLHQVLRVHFLFLLLLIAGIDLDGNTFARGGDDEIIHWLSTIYSIRYLKNKAPEMLQCYLEWLKAWGGKMPNQSLINDRVCEKIRAAMIFWRRKSSISWDECWRVINQLDRLGTSNTMVFD